MSHNFLYPSGRENITVKPHLSYRQNFIRQDICIVLYMLWWLAFSHPQSLNPCPLISHTQRLTYLLRRKLAIRESQVIKWAWEHLDEEGIYFGPEIETEEESDDSCTREEPGPSRKASGHPSPSPASHRKGKRKASGHPSPSPASHRKGKRKASGHPTLQQPSAKRARTSTEEESDYFLVSMKPVWCSGIICL